MECLPETKFQRQTQTSPTNANLMANKEALDASDNEAKTHVKIATKY